MNKVDAEKIKRRDKLRQLINNYDDLYYRRNFSPVSDNEYDSLKKELELLEKETGSVENSPASGFGSDLKAGFKKAKHETPMLSIDNTYSTEELREWGENILSDSGRESVPFTAELKIDGLAVSLIYRKGKLERAVTRGDGATGDLVTANVKTVSSLPKKVAGVLENFEVRGEVFMDNKTFERLNRGLEEEGKGFSKTREMPPRAL
ncbi:MAG: hypothetical protein ACLFQK_00110 [Fibrobacterota bacterium]